MPVKIKDQQVERLRASWLPFCETATDSALRALIDRAGFDLAAEALVMSPRPRWVADLVGEIA
jgi:hypothetical protein